MKRILAIIAAAVLISQTAPCYASDSPKQSEPVCLPILMYHQISKDRSKLSKYVISVDEFENDLRLLQKHGYTAITVKDLIDYTQRGSSLPEKPIMLTFDDGYESDYVYAFPLLKKYNTKAVFSVIGKYADLYSGDVSRHISYSHLSWAQITEMHESGLAEFHNHTYDMHDNQKRRGALRQRNESLADYQKAVNNDFQNLNDKYASHIGELPTAFTCPFGYYNNNLKDVVKNFGYSAILTSSENINMLTGDPDELLHLGRYVRTHNMDIDRLVGSWDDLKTRSVKK